MSTEMPYFRATTSVLNALSIIFEVIGQKITERGLVYHRGAFYADAAAAIRSIIEQNLPPFSESAYNWLWWAGEMEKRAAALGLDAQYAMQLPAPRVPHDVEDYQEISNRLDKIVALTIGTYLQEQTDSDIVPFGRITPAECAKLTHRFARYVLPAWCYSIEKLTPEHPGIRVTWPWLVKIQEELQSTYRKMGEVDHAGSAGAPGGVIPPISWPDP